MGAKHGRTGKFHALTYWGLLNKDGNVYQVTDLGRVSARPDDVSAAGAARNVITNGVFQDDTLEHAKEKEVQKAKG